MEKSERIMNGHATKEEVIAYIYKLTDWIYVNSLDTFTRTNYEIFLARSSHCCGEI